MSHGNELSYDVYCVLWSQYLRDHLLEYSGDDVKERVIVSVSYWVARYGMYTG